MTQTTENIIRTLDFSGGNNSWFDLWHTHLDWAGVGNQNWPLRKQHLEELLDLYRHLSVKLQGYPHPYQLWVEIDEEDASGDAVYIHTPNPNADNFPIQCEQEILPQFTHMELEQYIHGLNLSVKGIKTQEGNLYFIYNQKVGIPL